MAIFHIQPLFLLLASLFFLPALHAVDFEYCNKSGYSYGNVTNVDVSSFPDGHGNYELMITLFVYTQEILRKGVIEVYAKSEKVTDLLRRVDICHMGAQCPIEADSDVVIPLTEIPKYELEGDYKYEVALLDEVAEKPTVRLCINFSSQNGLCLSQFDGWKISFQVFM